MPRLKAANNAKTVLLADVSATDDFFDVEDASLFPDAPFRIVVNGEIMEVGAIDKVINRFSSITRSVEGTAPAFHPSGSSVENTWTAGTYGELVDQAEATAIIQSAVNNHKSETNAHLAKNIAIEDTAANFYANDVEGALDELASDVNAQHEEINTRQIENIGYGVQSGLNVTASAMPDMNVHVQPGIVYMPDGKRFEFDTPTTITVATADVTNPRKDIVYVGSNGSISYLAGTPSSTPAEPALPSGAIKLCVIDVPVGDTKIEQTQITDSRQLKNSLAAHLAEFEKLKLRTIAGVY